MLDSSQFAELLDCEDLILKMFMYLWLVVVNCEFLVRLQYGLVGLQIEVK